MENNKIIIIGAGAYAAVVAEAAMLKGLNIVGFADDNLALNTNVYKNLKVISSVTALNKNINHLFNSFIVAIGNNKIRAKLYNNLKKIYTPINLIHPNAVTSPSLIIGQGNVILAGAVINANVKIGNNNIINSMTLVDHDTIINSHCHIAQGCTLGSNVEISSNTLTKLGQNIDSFSKLQ